MAVQGLVREIFNLCERICRNRFHDGYYTQVDGRFDILIATDGYL